jgi:hypothetical protein
MHCWKLFVAMSKNRKSPMTLQKRNCLPACSTPFTTASMVTNPGSPAHAWGTVGVGRPDPVDVGHVGEVTTAL